jgi:hypothetical protein
MPISGVVTWHSGASRYNARCVLIDLPPRYNVLAPEALRVGADPGRGRAQRAQLQHLPRARRRRWPRWINHRSPGHLHPAGAGPQRQGSRLAIHAQQRRRRLPIAFNTVRPLAGASMEAKRLTALLSNGGGGQRGLHGRGSTSAHRPCMPPNSDPTSRNMDWQQPQAIVRAAEERRECAACEPRARGVLLPPGYMDSGERK